MGKFELFQVVKAPEKGVEYKLEIHPSIVANLKHNQKANTHITSIEKLLGTAAKRAAKQNMSAAEQKVLWTALKAKYEKSLEFGFENKYKVAYKKHPDLAGRMLTEAIFTKVNMDIAHRLTTDYYLVDTDWLRKDSYVDAAKSAVTGDVDKGDFKEMMKGIFETATDAQLASMWARHEAGPKKSRNKKKNERITAADIRDHKKGMR